MVLWCNHVFGCSVFRGKFIYYQDNALHEMVIRKRKWINGDLNFDNMLNGMLALFTASTFEGWPK